MGQYIGWFSWKTVKKHNNIIMITIDIPIVLIIVSVYVLWETGKMK